MSRTDDKILKATLRVVTAKGYNQATTRMIADAAGVSEMTLFRRFKTKENLVQTAYRLSLHQTVEVMEELFTTEGMDDLESSLSELDKRFLESADERSGRLIKEIGKMIVKERMQQQETKIMRERLAEYFQGQIDLGNMRAVNPHAASFVFFSVMAFEKLFSAIHGQTDAEGVTHEDIIDIIMHGIAGPDNGKTAVIGAEHDNVITKN
jgi:AcrR family transcriptional regulator